MRWNSPFNTASVGSFLLISILLLNLFTISDIDGITEINDQMVFQNNAIGVVVNEVYPTPIIDLNKDGNVDQEDEYPFLRAEKTAIRHMVEHDKSYLGFCLGHQLLADVLGAKVGPNTCRSVGFIEGSLTSQGQQHPLFRNLPNSFPLFKWHGQAALPPLPNHVEVLVTSQDCQV